MQTATLERRAKKDHAAAARRLVRAMQDAFNARDPQAMVRHLSADATWTNPLGTRVKGRDAVERLARRMLATSGQGFARYEIVDVMAVRPDVGIVNLRQVPVDEAGNALPHPAAVPIYVIARQHDGWKIVAGQNTLISTFEGAA